MTIKITKQELDALANDPKYMEYENKFKDYTDADFEAMAGYPNRSELDTSNVNKDEVYNSMKNMGRTPDMIKDPEAKAGYIKYLENTK